MHLREMRSGEICGSCGCIAWGGEKWYDGAFGVCCAEEWDKAWNDSEHNPSTVMDTERAGDAVRVNLDGRLDQRDDQGDRELQPDAPQNA